MHELVVPNFYVITEVCWNITAITGLVNLLTSCTTAF